MDIKMKYRHSVFIVAYTKTKTGIKYLLLKRKLHWVGWEFPKGGRRFYETKKGTAKREIKEETGLSAIKIKKFNISGKFKYDKEYPDRKGYLGQSYSLYATEVKKGEVKLDKREHSDYKWASFSEAMKKLKWKNQKKCLRITNSFLSKN